MSASRSETVGSSSLYGRRFLGVFFLSLAINLARIEGRKCVCTNRACKEEGKDTCKTKYSCYTEFIVTGHKFNENATTRGCTENPNQLSCEVSTSQFDNLHESTVPWNRMLWPKLKCCDSHDYCNADKYTNLSTWLRDQAKFENSNRDAALSMRSEPSGPTEKGQEPTDQPLQHRLKPLHVAALVLAISALISVLAACYVIMRFLRSNPYMAGSVE